MTEAGLAHRSRSPSGKTRRNNESLLAFRGTVCALKICGFQLYAVGLQKVQKRELTEFGSAHICRLSPEDAHLKRAAYDAVL